MANVLFANAAAGTVSVAIGSAATSLQFAYAPNAGPFPTTVGGNWFWLTLIDQYSYSSGIVPPVAREIVKVTNFSGGAMTIVRGQEGTTAQAWNIGDRIEARVTNQGLIDSTGAGGAPANATYITLNNTVPLTANRIITPGTLLTGTDAGAGGAYTLKVSDFGASGFVGNNSGGGAAAQLTVAQAQALIGGIIGSAVTSINYGTDAGKGAAGTAGKVWISSDTRVLYYDTGAVWQTLFPALTGDVTTVAGALASTITAAAVTNAKLANMGAATVKGSVAGGVPADLTQAQLTALVSTFTAGLSGTAPASGGGTSNFLRADGSWTAPGAALAQNTQILINGGMLVAQRIGGTTGTVAMSTAPQYGLDKWTAWFSTGAAVSGTLAQITNSTVGRTGYAMSCSALGATGATVISMRQRIESKDAIRLKNATASFSCIINQDTGSPQNCVVIIRKPTATDNYAGVTVIATSGSLAVPSATPTTISFSSVTMGDCSTGIEIEIQVPLGTGPVNKNVIMTEAVLGEGASVTFPYLEWEDEFDRLQRYYQKTFAYATVPANNVNLAWCCVAAQLAGTAAVAIGVRYLAPMRSGSAPTTTIYSTAGTANQAYDNSVTAACTTTSANSPQDSGFLLLYKGNAGTAVGDTISFNYTADADL